jgi:cAMP-dependent protein kinase regulator
MMGMQGQKQQVKTIEAGGFFGEVALVEHVNVRAADCIAKDRVKLLSMGRDTFERLMGPAETILAGQVSEYQKFNANASSCHSAAAEVV